MMAAGAQQEPLDPEQELSAMALWIEKTKGEKAWFYIAQEKDRLLPMATRLDLGYGTKMSATWKCWQTDRRHPTSSGCSARTFWQAGAKLRP